MKSLVVLCLLVAVAYGVPARNSYSDDDYEGFSLFPFARPSKKEVPVVVDYETGSDEDSSTFFRPYFRPFFINPFSFMNFGFSDFFSKPSWFDSLIPQGNPDAEVKNSTSSTKIVDGHKITVNQTTYENEKNGAIFKVQIIEVSPVDSTEKQIPSAEEGTEKGAEEGTEEGVETEMTPEQTDSAGTTAVSTEEIKPDSNSLDNEINREEMLASYELQGDDPSAGNNVETIDFGNGHVEKRQDAVDLSSDIRVNRLLAENAHRGGLFMVPPEVEVFDTLDFDYVNGNYQQQIIEPQFNQEIIQPQFNQQIIQPQFNQQQI